MGAESYSDCGVSVTGPGRGDNRESREHQSSVEVVKQRLINICFFLSGFVSVCVLTDSLRQFFFSDTYDMYEVS